MTVPLAYLNGELVSAADLAVPVDNVGFLLGVTVSERLRTFAGRLFRLEPHLQRLAHSLQIIQIDLGKRPEEIGDIARRLVAHNVELLSDGDDLGLVIFATPGKAGDQTPTLCLYTKPLAFADWVDAYQRGQNLAVSRVRQVPSACWPSELKCRSRMHYYLADLEAAQTDPQARALLLDDEGFVSEASTANIVIYQRDTGLVSPPPEKILPGISLEVLGELAARRGIPLVRRDLAVADVAAADEVLLTSTSPCMWPVLHFNGQPIGSGQPGPVFRQLLSDWSELVGVDIAEQARRFARR